MNTIEIKLRTMLETQDSLNQVVDVNWKERNFRWEDAIAVETVELFDHLPWKWWKNYNKPVDFEQVKLEAVDVWHFVLSRTIESCGIDDAVQDLAGYFEDRDIPAGGVINWEDVKDATREFLTDVTVDNYGGTRPAHAPAYTGSFVYLLETLGITLDDLYTTYIAKTQLNRLRWGNGYGTTYIKTWDGQEDNVWLAAYVKTLDVNALDFKDQVAAGLAAKYALVKKAALADPDVEELHQDKAA